MTIQSPKQLTNMSTATAIAYLCVPDFIPTSTRTAMATAIGATTLTIAGRQ